MWYVALVKTCEECIYFAEDPAKAELYRQYQELKCPMTEEPGQEISNECYRSVSDSVFIVFNFSDV